MNVFLYVSRHHATQMLKWKAFTFIYETLQLLLDNCRANGAIPIIGGDFSASIGFLLDVEDDDLLGSWGVGQRSGRGRWLVEWILSNGLRVANR